MNVTNFLFLTSFLSTSKYIETIMRHPVVTIHSDFKKFQSLGCLQKPQVYLLVNDFDLEATLQGWSKINTFNSRAKFWILTNDTPTRKYFKILSKFHVFEATILTDNGMFSYNPYKYENIAKPETNLGFFSGLPKFWRNTTVKVLTKCVVPFVDCSSQLGGLEPEILSLIRRILKFKIRYVMDNSSTFGLVKKNGTYSDSFGQLQQRQVDMVMGGFRTIGTTQYQDFDFSVNHLEDKLVWVVPKALPMVHWMRIIKTFEWRFWVILLVFTTVVGKIFEKISRISGEPLKLFSKFAFSTTFRLLVGEHLNKTPRKLEMRILFIFWIYFCMTFNIIFNSNLMNVFFGNFLSYQIDSFQEIVTSFLDVGLTADVMHILQRDPNWSLLTSKKDIITCPLGTYCLNRTIYKRNLVGCWAERSIKYRMTSYQTGVHLVDDHLLYYFVVFYFVKGYPMVPQISRAITQLKSAGLIQHIAAKSDRIEVAGSLLGSKVLNFIRLEGPFYFLFVGWGVATVVFFGELFEYYKTKKKQIYSSK